MLDYNKFTTQVDFILELIKIGSPPISEGYEKELIPWHFVQHLLRSRHPLDGWNIGLLALFMGVANWGVDWEGFKGNIPTDPTGLDWGGQRKRRGKHVLDGGSQFPWGGLGIPHLDSSGLTRDAYREWGEPYPKAINDKWHFNRLIKSAYKDEYFKWADNLLIKGDFQVWLCKYWLSKFWVDAWAWMKVICTSEDRRNDFTKYDVERATINTRISNSVSGVASKLRKVKKPQIFSKWQNTEVGKNGGEWVTLDRIPTNSEQIDTYVGYKHSRRSERAARRAMEQVQNAQRVAVLYDLFFETRIAIL